MRAHHFHDWQVTPEQAVAIQRELAKRVVHHDDLDSKNIRLIAGTDLSVSRAENTARGAVVVLDYPDLSAIESQTVETSIGFPYVPGLLSFREAPVILAAFENLSNTPDLVLVDGQGLAHPRRIGLASHLGLILDTPTIGCAKSRLCGEHGPVGTSAGEYAKLMDKGETIGAALRTRDNVRPLYISSGHRISLGTAMEWVLKCCRGYRLPEPTRLAHLAAGERLKTES